MLMSLATLMRDYRPGSRDEPWTWDDEFRDLWTRGRDRTERVMKSIQEVGQWDPICLGNDGRVWDGHHRIAAAYRLGLDMVLVES